MTRLTRFATLAGALTTAYALVWLQVFHIPLIDASTEDQLLPVVRYKLVSPLIRGMVLTIALTCYVCADCDAIYAGYSGNRYRGGCS